MQLGGFVALTMVFLGVAELSRRGVALGKLSDGGGNIKTTNDVKQFVGNCCSFMVGSCSEQQFLSCLWPNDEQKKSPCDKRRVCVLLF